MNDRELLERAAKAAGMWGTDFELEEDSEAPIFSEEKGFRLAYGRGWWGPHTDDGDALRLAVKLRMLIEPCRTMAGKFIEVHAYPSGRGDCAGVATFGDDEAAATRRAIVRAAAAMAHAADAQGAVGAA